MPAPDRVGQVQSFNNVINPLKGIVGHYSDLEVDALLAGLSGGTLQTVDLSAYATTAYVDGELAKVYDKAAVDAAIATAVAGLAAPDLTGLATEQFVTDAVAAIPPTDLSDYYTKPEVDQKFVDAATGGTVDLSGYATQQELTDAIAAIPTPDLTGLATETFVTDAVAAVPTVTVYEQDAQPTEGKDGDLWLSAGAERTALTLGDVDAEISKALAEKPSLTEAEVVAIVRKTMSGGKELPADRDWSATVLANVSLGAVGLIEARLRNGQITLRGELTWTNAGPGTWTNVRSLTANFPRPDVTYQGVIIGIETGVSYRFVAYRIQPDGMIALCPIGGKITSVTFDGATAYV